MQKADGSDSRNITSLQTDVEKIKTAVADAKKTADGADRKASDNERAIGDKVGRSSIAQETGDSPTKVMSQKAVTDAIEKAEKNNDNAEVRKIADVVNGEKKERNVEIDFSKLKQIVSQLIFQNTGKWMSFTTGFKYYLIPNDGYKEVTITPLHSKTYYTFLKSDSHVSDTVPDYCEGYSNVKDVSSAETLRRGLQVHISSNTS